MHRDGGRASRQGKTAVCALATRRQRRCYEVGDALSRAWHQQRVVRNVEGSKAHRVIQDRASDRPGAHGGSLEWDKGGRSAEEAGAIGYLPCAMLNASRSASRWGQSAPAKNGQFNFLPFVRRCPANASEERWRDRLRRYYREIEIDPAAPVPEQNEPRSIPRCATSVEETKPESELPFGAPRSRGCCWRLKGGRVPGDESADERRRGAVAAARGSAVREGLTRRGLAAFSQR